MQGLECAVFEGGTHTEWAQQWLSERRGSRYVHMQTLALGVGGKAPPICALQLAQTDLYRFQVCVLPVDAQNLSWARTALANVDHFSIPHLGLAHRLRAEALGDLLQLGMADFVNCDADVQELRARSLQAIRRLGSRQVGWHTSNAEVPDQDTSQVSEPQLAYGAGCNADDVGIEDDIQALNFKLAKQRLIDKFEVTFLNQSLTRHRGNVTRAALECEKHRRAFWALMQKHRINARAFRPN